MESYFAIFPKSSVNLSPFVFTIIIRAYHKQLMFLFQLYIKAVSWDDNMRYNRIRYIHSYKEFMLKENRLSGNTNS